MQFTGSIFKCSAVKIMYGSFIMHPIQCSLYPNRILTPPPRGD